MSSRTFWAGAALNIWNGLNVRANFPAAGFCSPAVTKRVVSPAFAVNPLSRFFYPVEPRCATTFACGIVFDAASGTAHAELSCGTALVTSQAIRARRHVRRRGVLACGAFNAHACASTGAFVRDRPCAACDALALRSRVGNRPIGHSTPLTTKIV